MTALLDQAFGHLGLARVSARLATEALTAENPAQRMQPRPGFLAGIRLDLTPVVNPTINDL